mgnify:CR=1 FL=1
MSKTIVNEDTGEEEVVYTQAELDAIKKEADDKILDNENHTKKKLEEFQTGKTAQELKDIERDRAIAEANELAKKAEATATATVEGARKKVVNYMAEQVVGQDKELRTKLDSALDIIEAGRVAKGLDIADEKSIQEMMIQAAQMSGINSVSSQSPSFPLTNGMAPSFIKTADELSDAEHERFLRETGQEVPKKAI